MCSLRQNLTPFPVVPQRVPARCLNFAEPLSAVDGMSAGLCSYCVRTQLWDSIDCAGKTVCEHEIQRFVAMSKGPQEQLSS